MSSIRTEGIPEDWFDTAAQEIFEHIAENPDTFKLRAEIRDILYDIQLRAYNAKWDSDGSIFKDNAIRELIDMGKVRLATKMMKEWDI